MGPVGPKPNKVIKGLRIHDSGTSRTAMLNAKVVLLIDFAYVID